MRFKLSSVDYIILYVLCYTVIHANYRILYYNMTNPNKIVYTVHIVPMNVSILNIYILYQGVFVNNYYYIIIRTKKRYNNSLILVV